MDVWKGDSPSYEIPRNKRMVCDTEKLVIGHNNL